MNIEKSSKEKPGRLPLVVTLFIICFVIILIYSGVSAFIFMAFGGFFDLSSPGDREILASLILPLIPFAIALLYIRFQQTKIHQRVPSTFWWLFILSLLVGGLTVVSTYSLWVLSIAFFGAWFLGIIELFSYYKN